MCPDPVGRLLYPGRKLPQLTVEDCYAQKGIGRVRCNVSRCLENLGSCCLPTGCVNPVEKMHVPLKEGNTTLRVTAPPNVCGPPASACCMGNGVCTMMNPPVREQVSFFLDLSCGEVGVCGDEFPFGDPDSCVLYVERLL